MVNDATTTTTAIGFLLRQNETADGPLAFLLLAVVYRVKTAVKVKFTQVVDVATKEKRSSRPKNPPLPVAL